MSEVQFKGFGVVDREDWKHTKLISFKNRKFNDNDVDVKVECCGVCGSDIHRASSHWGPCKEGQVVGHEIVGHVVRVGSACKLGLKIGDRVGIGAQAFSCLKCERCLDGHEPYCAHFVSTYGRPYADGFIGQGGYANYVRCLENFVIPIPDNIPSETAAPLMCGGITVFSPLYRHNCGPGKKVGIVGIGGIGHFGVILAKAMGAEVYAFSRRQNKKEDALKLGADHYIATLEDENWVDGLYNKLDLVVLCANSFSDIDLGKFAKVMKFGGVIQSIVAPPVGENIVLPPFGVSGITIGSSAIGSPNEIKILLDLVSKKNLKFWVEPIPISEEGVFQVFDRMEKGDVRFRFTLTDYNKQFD